MCTFTGLLLDLKNNHGHLAQVSIVHPLIMINVPFISRSSPGTTRTFILSLWIWMQGLED